MQKQEILKSLKKACNNNSVRLPQPLGFSNTENCLTIAIPKERTYRNMQEDNSAFEAWAIVLKRWIVSIETVIIKWEEPDLDDDSNKMPHYQRFLYRAKKFTESFSWAEMEEANKRCLSKLKIYNGKKNILNVPSGIRTRNVTERKDLHEYSENEMENLILSDPAVLESFKKRFDLKIVDSQLPVGVFDEVKSQYTRIFAGGKSAIDIWGISNDGNTCSIFELKNSKNNKVGALSEMMFYSFVIQDVINGNIEFHSLKYPGLKEIIQAEKIKCYLLAPNTHPLIDDKVFERLNDSGSSILFQPAIIGK